MNLLWTAYFWSCQLNYNSEFSESFTRILTWKFMWWDLLSGPTMDYIYRIESLKRRIISSYKEILPFSMQKVLCTLPYCEVCRNNFFLAARLGNKYTKTRKAWTTFLFVRIFPAENKTIPEQNVKNVLTVLFEEIFGLSLVQSRVDSKVKIFGKLFLLWKMQHFLAKYTVKVFYLWIYNFYGSLTSLTF